MGEVYKADRHPAGADRRHQGAARACAPPTPERKQRFERHTEAKVISGLNHPHICTLYEFDTQDGTDFLVMEYLEGETLAERLQKGALPLDQALRYAIEIADALDKAHRQGVTHRDLKPANIMLTKAGAKLLDFGLAKLTPTGPQSDASTKLADALTEQGTILGTFQYMAPEQLEGKDADARSDIWAFGCVVYEMVTGKKAFKGTSQANLIHSIMGAEPQPMSSLQSTSPSSLDRLVSACLAKDREDRWQTARDVVRQLKEIQVDTASGAVSPSGDAAAASVSHESQSSRRWLWPTVAATFALLALGVGLWAPSLREPPRPLVFHEPPPEGTEFVAAPSPSPDGRFLAMRAVDNQGDVKIWVRPIDADRAQALDGTEGASLMIWSPDGEDLAFHVQGELRRTPRRGGPVRPIATVDVAPIGGGIWSASGDLIVASTTQGVVRVSASGGTARTIMQREGVQYRSLELAPGTDRLVFVEFGGEQPGLYTANLDGNDRVLLVPGDVNVVRTVAPDLLIYEQDGLMVAQRFDEAQRALDGESFPIAEQVPMRSTWFSGDRFRVGYNSGGHVLTFLPSVTNLGRLTWFDRQGRRTGTAGPDGLYEEVHLSPDGTRLLSVQLASNNRDLWISNLEQDGAVIRFSDDPGIDHLATFSPDSSRVAWEAHGDGVLDIMQRPADSSTPAVLLRRWGRGGGVDDWSPDGQFILYRSTDGLTRQNLWAVPVDESGEPTVLIGSPFNETNGRFSPEGSLLAYVSDATGEQEVYVQRLDGMQVAGGAQRVSVSGGTHPVWRQDGGELFFLSQGRLMAVAISTTGDTVDIGSPLELFALGVPLDFYSPYASMPDGERFIGIMPASEQTGGLATVILNWAAGLED